MTRKVKPLIQLEQLEPRIMLSGDTLLNIAPNPDQDTILDNPSKVVQEAELLHINEQVEEQISQELISSDTPDINIYEPIFTLTKDNTTDEQSVDADLSVGNIGSVQVNSEIAVLSNDSCGDIKSKVVTTDDGSTPTYIYDGEITVEETLSIEIRGPPLSETVALSGMHLVDPTIDYFKEQVIYLDFDGANDVTYNGPVTIEGVDIPAFAVPSYLSVQEDAVVDQILEGLRQTFAGSGVVFTVEKPESHTLYSTIYIGGDDSAFAGYGSFLGLAEQVDVGNKDFSDKAFVFSDRILMGQSSADCAAKCLADVIAHEIGHLLGFEHNVEIPNGALLSAVAQIVIDQDTTWPEGTYTHDSVHITGGATLTFEGRVTLNAEYLIIDAGSSISADGKGYGASQGPGAGTQTGGQYNRGSGGGYGGEGGPYSNLAGGSTYGSAVTPTELGSGGGVPGYGGAGGGAIRLVVTDTLTVNGRISANGNDGYYQQVCTMWGCTVRDGGGGSGGSIYVTTRNLVGTGEITADGGDAGSGAGGGGGGRISIYYESMSFTGTTSASGGISSNSSHYAKDGTARFLDVINNDLYVYVSYQFHESESPFGFNNIVVTDAEVTVDDNVEISAANFHISDGSSVVINGVSVLSVPYLRINNGSTVVINGSSSLSVTDLSVESGSELRLNGTETIIADTITLTGQGSQITHVSGGRIDISVPTLTIGAGSSISADGKGYGSSEGPGAGTQTGGQYNRGSGGGYGGEGGPYSNLAGGSTYGSAVTPVELGSGGGVPGYGGAGGGAIRLVVTDTLTVNGRISANGNDGHYQLVCTMWGCNIRDGGGGSGGSIYITTQNLVGTGEIAADGGDAGQDGGGGGGGGGRIAIYYETLSFTGATSADGGISSESSHYGEEGTVLIDSLTQVRQL